MTKVFLFILLFQACSKPDSPPTPPATGVMDYSGKHDILRMSNGLQYHTGLLHEAKLKSPKSVEDRHYAKLEDCGALPDSFDLRPLGVVPKIKDQGQCGSCWSFSKTGSLESALLGQGKAMTLSEQEMVSCDTEQYGCDGGLLSDFNYQIKHGQGLASDFPYTSGNTGSNGSCKTIAKAAQGVSFQYVGAANRGPTDTELKCALYKYHTVPWITVGATNSWGNPPASEKTAYTSCSNSQTNHAVGVVGYWTDKQGKTQFIMKNSWGTSWGDNGYMSLGLGCDNFGEEAAFIQVNQVPTPSPSPSPTPVPPSPSPSPTPSPGPCSNPVVRLPAEVQVFAGVEIMLGTKAESSVDYTWSVSGITVGTGPTLYVTPVKDAVYKLDAKNSCGSATGSVRVRIVESK